MIAAPDLDWTMPDPSAAYSIVTLWGDYKRSGRRSPQPTRRLQGTAACAYIGLSCDRRSRGMGPSCDQNRRG